VSTRAAALLLALVLSVLAAPAAAGVGAERRGALEARQALDRGILVEINAERAERGLRPLRPSPALAAAARTHSLLMARRGFFAHERPAGGPFWRRIERFYASDGYRSWAVGENLVWRSPDLDPSQAVRLWLASPPHRRVLLDPKWEEIGLAAVHAASAPGAFSGLPVTIVTADFGLRVR